MSERWRILIVDDNAFDRVEAKSALLKGTSRKIEFVEAASAREGLAAATTEGACFDCLVLDYDLQDHDAPWLLERLPRVDGITAVPVLVVTGSTVANNRLAVRAGAQDYLGKDWLTPDSIVRSVETAIERHAIYCKLAEANRIVRENEALSRAVIESSSDCIKIIDEHGRLESLNGPGLVMLEVESLSHLKGKEWLSLWPEPGRSLAAQALERARNGSEGRFQALCPTFKGTRKWWDVTVTPLAGGSGRRGHFLSVSRDITQLVRANDAIREAAERERALAVSVPTLLAIFDRNGECEFRNPQWTAYTGISFDRLQQRTLFAGVDDPPGDADARKRALMSEGKPFDLEVKLRRHDGVLRWFLCRSVPAHDADGQVTKWYSTCMDIDDLRKTQDALAVAQEQLQQQAHGLEREVADRTARLTDMVAEAESVSYSISHDMRQPLRSMRQYSQILLEDHAGALDETARRYLDRIVAGADRLDRLIQDVLTLGRMTRQEIALSRVDLEPLVDEILRHYPTFQSAAGLFNVRRPLPAVWADDTPLTQALANLFGNAFKFARSDVPLRIDIWAEDVDGGRVRLYVADNGIGIAPEHFDRIWKIFERVDYGIDGTGIGLSIVRKAIERMNGAVGVRSEAGEGSTFWIELDKATT